MRGRAGAEIDVRINPAVLMAATEALLTIPALRIGPTLQSSSARRA